MQPTYRSYPQQQQTPQRSLHAAVTRRGIGPMISGPGSHPQNSLTPAQMEAQRQAQTLASERAKMKSRKPTDQNIPDGVADCIIGDGVQRYRDLKELERRLDSTMSRKRLDIADNVNRNVKRFRTLRIWISNTVEDQPWQQDGLSADAFDFSSNMDSLYRVKIEARLLDEEVDDEDSDDSEDEDEDANGDPMDEDDKEKKVKTKAEVKKEKFSHFFKAMTVEYDRNRQKEGTYHSVEWKKPAVAPNAPSLPNAADFDQLVFKRGGDENVNVVIHLTRDENPERFRLSPVLADILDTDIATRAEAVMGIWDYVKVMGLQEDDEKRHFDCDDKLRALLGREKGYIPYIPDSILPHLSALATIKLPYTIRVDREFHENDPKPTIYDVQVQVDDPLKGALQNYLTNPIYAHDLHEIATLNDHLTLLVQKTANSKSKQMFFDALSKNPTEFIARWLSSQKRDLEIIAGEAARGGSEDASGNEWRRGGKNSIWGSDHVRESVNLMVSTKPKA